MTMYGYENAWIMTAQLNEKKDGCELCTRPLVLCKDCKNLIDHYGFMDDGYCKKMREDYNAKLKPKKDWFCADGERKDK